MEPILSYLLKSAIWLTLFGVVYVVFLRNERFFNLNRAYLVFGLLAAFIFPLITIRYLVTLPMPATTVSAGIPVAGAVETVERNPVTWPIIVGGLILGGSLFFLVRLMIQTLRVVKIIRKSHIERTHSMKVVRTNSFPFSFSFFSYVIVNPSLRESEIREIVAHESAHVGQNHWIDLVLAELLCTLQWFNPMAWLYSHYIKQNHEYLADQAALKSTSDPATYKAVLINQLLGGEAIRLGHAFSFSLNKKRFIMMKDNSTSALKRLKVLLILPLMALVFYAYAEPRYEYETKQAITESPAEANQPQSQNEKQIKGKVVQQNGDPLAGTSIIAKGTTNGTVSNRNGEFSISGLDKNSTLVFSFVGFKTIQRPAKFDEPMNIVMVRDTVKLPPTGNIRMSAVPDGNQLLLLNGTEIPFKDLEQIDPDDIESINVYKDKVALEKFGQKGKRGVISITTKDSDTDEAMVAENGQNNNGDQEPQKKTKTFDGKPVFFVVEDMPKFQGGQEALNAYVMKNLKYPKEAHDKGIQGRVYVSFIIPPNGKPAEVKIARSVHPILDKEAQRVVEEMPNWIPGKQRGKKVAVHYTMPINFVLAPKKKEQVPPPPPPPPVKNNQNTEASDKDEAVVFFVVEKMPKFPGGEEALPNYFKENTNYPKAAKENGIMGRVYVKFVIDKTGKVIDPEIARGVDPSLDKEALRVVSEMPDWIPGKQRGQKVAVSYTVPINFGLSDPPKEEVIEVPKTIEIKKH